MGAVALTTLFIVTASAARGAPTIGRSRAQQQECYRGCVAGRYGCLCEHACACASVNEECDDGPSGSGQCRCQLGFELQCGAESPLRPQRPRTGTRRSHTLDELNFDVPVGAIPSIAMEAGYHPDILTPESMAGRAAGCAKDAIDGNEACEPRDMTLSACGG